MLLFKYSPFLIFSHKEFGTIFDMTEFLTELFNTKQT